MKTPEHIKEQVYDDLTDIYCLSSAEMSALRDVNTSIQLQRNGLLAHQNELLKQLIYVLTPIAIISSVKNKPLTGEV